MNRLFIALVLMGVNLVRAEEGYHIHEATSWGGNPLIPGQEWKVHDNNRPQPKRVIPGEYTGPVSAPADAEILFDGKSTVGFWPSEWDVKDGVLIAGKGSLSAKRTYGDMQLHIEWRTPKPLVLGEYASDLGNSGIYIMNRYELQIHDSYSCKLYADGTAGAVYGQHPPLVNVCRKPGEWQTFDVYFKAPVFDGDKLVAPARMTVLHNGVFVQVGSELTGPTGHNKVMAYEPHEPKQSFFIQGSKNPVEFRNIWVRNLEAE